MTRVVGAGGGIKLTLIETEDPVCSTLEPLLCRNPEAIGSTGDNLGGG